MVVYDKNGLVIYKTRNRGKFLEEEWRKKCGIREHYGSTVQDFGFWPKNISKDEKSVVEIAAKKYDYLKFGWTVKSFVITPLEEIIFYQLDTLGEEYCG